MEQSGDLPAPRPDAAASLRISDEDRHRVAEVLREAAGEGRIDLEELDERLGAAYAAMTYGDLVPITADLPVAGGASPPAARSSPSQARARSGPPGPRFAHSVAVMSDTRRQGRWTAEESHVAVSVMGTVVLDLREADFTGPELRVTANAVMGDVRILVDAATTVHVSGVALMGEFRERDPDVLFDDEAGGRPVVRVQGLALMGSVTVQRKGPPGERLARRHRLGLH